ncbi:hypothetical protein DAPPUDRAFT_259456 [Daphnia pulex]|uniref:Uncharacterized protein n=1 Tax=Daphnia pulex TaxID=6669 RepID=E9HH92_DAPPU|nr:hypothetical protein DAPPUDRAFT_259456 [Daphnia pulex]|eukprot:EFX68902.1 hypothetical protein DAPPUDRAFT_259456 [Daphnia pulex]
MFCSDEFLNVETCSTTLESEASLLVPEAVFVEEYTIAIAEKLLFPSLDSLTSYEGKQTIMPIDSEMFCDDDFPNVETCSTTLEQLMFSTVALIRRE